MTRPMEPVGILDHDHERNPEPVLCDTCMAHLLYVRALRCEDEGFSYEQREAAWEAYEAARAAERKSRGVQQ